MLRRLALVIALVAGCSGGPGTNDPVAPTTPAPDVLAPTKSLAETGTPEVRELVLAVQAIDGDAKAWEWLSEADESFPTAIEGRPPATVERVWDALIAWDASGGAIALPCNHVDIPLAMELLRVARAGLAPAKEDADPLVRATVHLSGELATPSNAMIVVAVGVNLWKAAEDWRALQGRPAHAEALAPTVGGLLEAGRTDLRCTIAMARAATRDAREWTKDRTEVEERRRELRLPLDDEWFEEELAQYGGFWAETEELLGAVTSLDGLRALHAERRRSAATHPQSALVRIMGEVLISERMPRILTELEAIVVASP